MPWALKKLLNRSICHLGCWIGWAEISWSSVIFARLCPYASLGAHQHSHLLALLLPNEVRTPYHLRPRHHNRQLTPKVNKLSDSNFIQRILYKDSYWLSCILSVGLSCLWPPCIAGCGHTYFHPVVSSFFYFISSPNLRGPTLDVYHTSTHGVALVRI